MNHVAVRVRLGEWVGWWAGGVFICATASPLGPGRPRPPTSRGLVQEHKGGPIPLGEVSGEVP
jgi:hypothetical protein